MVAERKQPLALLVGVVEHLVDVAALGLALPLLIASDTATASAADVATPTAAPPATALRAEEGAWSSPRDQHYYYHPPHPRQSGLTGWRRLQTLLDSE